MTHTVTAMEHRHSIIGAKQYRIVDPFRIERDEVTHVKPTYISNVVRTSKYTWINFLPLCLMQEFRRVRCTFSPRFVSPEAFTVWTNAAAL